MRGAFHSFCCPICRLPITADGNTLKCKNHHSFDIAAQGYVNLLLSGKPESGDSKMMTAARNHFLNQGYYSCLRNAVTALCTEICLRGGFRRPLLVDAGCGEGYYTSAVCDGLIAGGIDACAAGFDISKPAIRIAAKRGSSAGFAVASAFDLPLPDGCAQVMLSIFAPLCRDEFRRVLAAGGFLIIAAPGPRHLFGLKEVLYERPYENDENRFDFDGFEFVGMRRVSRVVTLRSPEDIRNLFSMTPYYWKTSQQGSRRLEALDALDTELEFELHVFKKV